MTDGTADSPARRAVTGGPTDPQPRRHPRVSERLAALARFTLRHKALVIGYGWAPQWFSRCCSPSWKPWCANGRWTSFLAMPLLADG